MKNKIQVRHYLSNKSFNSDIDFAMISAYCSKQFGIQLEKPEPSQSQNSISCPDFIEWMNGGLEAGEVVKCGNFVGIVINSNPEYATLYSVSDFKGSNFNYNTVSIQDIQTPEESVLKRFYELFMLSGKEFNRLTLEITSKYVPKVGDLVMFSRLKGIDHEKCYGVVRMIEDGDVIMYCYTDENDDVHYQNLSENIGKLEDYQFTPIELNHYGRKKLEDLLNKRGMSWNHSAKRVESKEMRQKAGGFYCYINDKLQVVTAKEDGKPSTASAKRYQVGNYSKVREKMMRCQAEISEVLKKYMAEPE